MKKIILAMLLVTALSIGVVNAQPYKRSIGISLSPAMGINGKYFLNTTSAIEAMVTYNISSNSPMVTAVYEYHIVLVDNFYLYAGGGINIGAYGSRNMNAKFAFGIDPIVGFEYVFDETPIVIAIDYKPEINLTCNSQWNMASLKVRYKF